MQPRKLFCKDCKKEIGYAIVGTNDTQKKHQKKFPNHRKFVEIV
jgi:hypothetical protein